MEAITQKLLLWGIITLCSGMLTTLAFIFIKFPAHVRKQIQETKQLTRELLDVLEQRIEEKESFRESRIDKEIKLSILNLKTYLLEYFLKNK